MKLDQDRDCSQAVRVENAFTRTLLPLDEHMQLFIFFLNAPNLTDFKTDNVKCLDYSFWQHVELPRPDTSPADEPTLLSAAFPLSLRLPPHYFPYSLFSLLFLPAAHILGSLNYFPSHSAHSPFHEKHHNKDAMHHCFLPGPSRDAFNGQNFNGQTLKRRSKRPIAKKKNWKNLNGQTSNRPKFSK